MVIESWNIRSLLIRVKYWCVKFIELVTVITVQMFWWLGKLECGETVSNFEKKCSQFYLKMSLADAIGVYSGKTVFRHFSSTVWSCIKNRLTVPPWTDWMPVIVCSKTLHWFDVCQFCFFFWLLFEFSINTKHIYTENVIITFHQCWAVSYIVLMY
jgi:hypothetical protein